MKLATIRNGARDGALVVVSGDLTRCVAVPEIARTLQAALDAWELAAPSLRAISVELDAGRMPDAVTFDPKAAMAPLPRAYQWADGSAYVNHVELVRRARGAAMPPEFWTDPLMYQGASDNMLGACEDMVLADEAWGIDFEAEVAVVTGDVPMGTTAAEALRHVRLLMLVNDVSLRNLVHCALCLVVTFFSVAVLFLLLGAEFVSFAQVMVYVGAIAILIVFAILLTRKRSTGKKRRR